MGASPLADSDGPVTVVVTSDGAAIPDTAAVLSVATRAEIGRIPEAVVVLEDGDPASLAFPLTDGTTFAPGAEIEIAAGYGDAEPAKLFKGVVVAMRLKIDGGRTPRLVVTCRDTAFKLTLGRRSAVYADQKDSDVVASLASDAGLTADVTATTVQHTALVQYRCTDWDFILARAAANGLLVWADQGTLSAKAPDLAAAASLTVTYGNDLVRFDGEIDARTQFASVSASAWDIAQQQAASGDAATDAASPWGDLTGAALADIGALPAFLIATAAPIDTTGLEAIAKGRQNRAGLARLRGQVHFQGSALATLGATLELAGLSARFNGTGLIASVVHRIEAGDWTTEAGLGLPPDAAAGDRSGGEAPGAAGLTLPARGLQTGKVVKLTGDPAGQSMIQVSLPLLGADAGPLWARLGAPYASNGAGIAFLPEVGDEVVVGFLDDDPGFPVVLGSLHSASLPPAVTATEENFVKAILTPEKLKVEFDDEKKTITVATPAGNTVVLDDDAQSVTLTDQTGNAVTLDSGGITLDSAGDVTIKATGAVAIKAGTDATLAGMNVTATADTGFKASGNASAELSAAGQLKIQGALVQIN